jgi:hypothetical protein
MSDKWFLIWSPPPFLTEDEELLLGQLRRRSSHDAHGFGTLGGKRLLPMKDIDFDNTPILHEQAAEDIESRSVTAALIVMTQAGGRRNHLAKQPP